uniref:Small ribosomal subunit protein uS5 n=1 Tax=Parascaris univalens TaxID=6257 RepID=A0A915A613_PARUN
FMDRRGAFRGGFGSYSFGSFGGSSDSRISNGSLDRSWTRSRSRGGGRPAAIRNRRVTSDAEKPWIPVTKLGRLVKEGKVKTVEDIYLHSVSIKEFQIIDHILPHLHEDVLKIMPVQKMTKNGLRTRFKAFVAMGDRDGHVGVGVKCAKEVAAAIRGAVFNAKTAMIPVRRGFWNSTSGSPHTVASKITGIHNEVRVRLYPAPRNTGIVGPPLVQRVLDLGGIKDCYTSVSNPFFLGHLIKATYLAIRMTYWYIPPRNADNEEVYERSLDTQKQFMERKLNAATSH